MATQSLPNILKQIEDLQRQAERVRKAEVDGVVGRIKEAIRTYGLTAADLGLGRKARARKSPAAAPARARKTSTAGAAKFRDAESGRTWSGRGRRPQWFVNAIASGKTPEDLMA